MLIVLAPWSHNTYVGLLLSEYNSAPSLWCISDVRYHEKSYSGVLVTYHVYAFLHLQICRFTFPSLFFFSFFFFSNDILAFWHNISAYHDSSILNEWFIKLILQCLMIASIIPLFKIYKWQYYSPYLLSIIC